MSEISDLEGRISAAMARIGRGVETLQGAAAQPGIGDDVQALRRALENEAMVTAQMEERVRALSAQQSELEAALEAEKASHSDTAAALLKADDALAAAQELAEDAQQEASLAAATASSASSGENIVATREAMEQLGLRLRRLRRLNRMVRENNEKLRVAASAGVTDPALMDQALQVELDSVKALRDAELAEADVILSGLRPMLAGQLNLEAAGDLVSPSMGED